jgi:hypothetical protein
LKERSRYEGTACLFMQLNVIHGVLSNTRLGAGGRGGWR